jgi:GTPase SAR1 family protein
MSTELALPPGEGKRRGAAATYKILIIGDSSVGKTSFLNRYCDETFPSGALIATVGKSKSLWYALHVSEVVVCVGIDYKTKHIVLDDETVKLQIWFVSRFLKDHSHII